MNFEQEKKYMLKNLPKGVAKNTWVERTSNYGNRTITKGKKYRVINYFRYLNNYGAKGERYCMWDEFITIKNDEGWTVKMNLIGFTPCDAPLTKVQQLQTRIKELEVTIENMKAIAGEKIEPINGISSVDYPSDNETLVNKVFDELIQIEYAFCSKCNEQLNNVLKNENYCQNCGRKIIRK